MKLPPQPKGHPIIGHLMGFKNDPINFMMNSAAKHGDISVSYTHLTLPTTPYV